MCEGLTIPITDERLKEIALEIDQKYLDNNPQGGSTGTFFIGMREGDKINLQVGNVGDSRVLARINGEAVALTQDHKPTNEEERRRIHACKGYVENARVNGSLALSRAFGDADYKKFDGDQVTQQVIALPDITRATVACNGNDFAVLACDGVFEGSFSNEEVIEFVAELLEGGETDLALISFKVCLEAIARGSKDNISAMVVQFQDGTAVVGAAHEFVPGPMAAPTHSGFRRAYWGMAAKADMTPAAVMERRYDNILAEKAAPTADTDESALEAELELFKDGPPASLSGEQRTAWFEQIVTQLNSLGGGEDPASTLLQLQQRGIPLSALVDALQNGDDN